MMKCSGIDAFTRAPISLEARDGVITHVDDLLPPASPATLLAPGFIDLQVNGFAGVDFCSPAASLPDIERALKAIFSTGVTRLFPTVITGGIDDMLRAAENLARAKRTLPNGRAFEGIHMEGPHISPTDGPRGAHPARQVRPPDTREFDRWQEAAEGAIRLVTVSAHWPETPAYIRHLVSRGVVVAIGHTDATGDQIDAAVAAGATLSTHLGNGANSMLPRHPNYLWHQMAEDRLAASLIVDGIHLGRAFVVTALRAKGIERIVLITDAVMPAGCPPGPYMLGEVEVELKPDNRVVLRGGDRLAGSAITMDRAIETFIRLTGASLPQVLSTATRNPARIGRINGRLRGLEPGERADVVEFSWDAQRTSMNVLRTWLDGELVYSHA
jgi:N-acetylglucosamine-6-phosphate deacetylase